ncbi:MAG: hypothetical protein ABIY70_09965 [Capsulimonas sp.]|uniref:hypothetical protein n=1 Tax=Capsulimonas sp. TaxID=2494211 RepID=UPI003267B3A7
MAGENQTIDVLLQRYSHSGTALLDWIRPRIDNSMLQEISQADYGFDAHKKLAALLQIRDEPQIQLPMEFGTQEVLELIRWSGPDDRDWREDDWEHNHLRRAFCCAVLLTIADNRKARANLTHENSSLITLVESSLLLGAEAIHNTLGLLCWRILRMTPEDEAADGEYPFFAMAILLARVAIFEPEQDPSELTLLSNWVVAEEARAQLERWRVESDEWLLGLTNFDSRHDRWRKVALEVLIDPPMRIPEPAASALLGIAEKFVPVKG